MGGLHRALVGVSTNVDPHLTGLRRISKQMYRTSDVQEVSPVFLVEEESSQLLVVVFSLRTLLGAKEFFEKFKKIEILTPQSVEVCLLAFEDVVLRSPELTLPSVDLSTQKKWCHPCAYLWPEYIHPIEGLSLKALESQIKTRETITFYSQSKSVLDFLSLET